MSEKPERGAVSAGGGEARSEGPDKGKQRSSDKVVTPPAMGGASTGYRALRERKRKPPPNAFYDCDNDADEDDVVTARDNESREYEVLHTAKKQKQKYANRVDEEQKVSPSEVKSCNENSKKRKKLTGGNALMCHQCQRNDKGRVIWCQSCTNKCFCVPCMQRWYPNLSEEEFAAKCPYCRKICNCKACLRKQGAKEQPPKMNISEVNRIHYACHVLRLLLPWLRKLLQEQMEEKELEAKVKGVLVNEVRLEQAKCNLDGHVYWWK